MYEVQDLRSVKKLSSSNQITLDSGTNQRYMGLIFDKHFVFRVQYSQLWVRDGINVYKTGVENGILRWEVAEKIRSLCLNRKSCLRNRANPKTYGDKITFKH